MSQSNRETGHYKNVASFQALLQQCQLLNTAYKPSRSDMSVTAMQLKLSHATDVMDRLTTAETMLTASSETRFRAYDALPKLATRAVSALEVSNPDTVYFKTAKHYLGKLRGTRLGHTEAKPAGDMDSAAEAAHTVSVSQHSYDAQARHFAHIVDAIAQEPDYKPNEAELGLDVLRSVAEQLQTLNNSVVDAAYKRNLLLKERDQVLYDAHIGVLATAASVKKYMKMAFGTQSRELHAANALPFRRR